MEEIGHLRRQCEEFAIDHKVRIEKEKQLSDNGKQLLKRLSGKKT